MTEPTDKVPEDVTGLDDYFGTDHLKDNLRGRSVRGGAVTMMAQGLRIILRVGSTVVLARILTPEEFGLIAMVVAVTGFLMMFKDMGLSMATVQRKEVNHGQISTLFWVNVGLSVGIMALTAALSPVIAWFYGEPRVLGITLALSAGFVFSGLSIQHQALLRRRMRFWALALIDVSSVLIAVVAAVVSALLGAGYWSLVVMNLVLPMATAAGVWIACGWRPGYPVRRSGVRSMLAFGGNLTGFNMINYFARNLDKVLIGRVWGGSPLGLYNRAYSLLLLPLGQINAPIGAVAIPALSHLQTDRERFRRYYLKSLSLVAFLTIPISVFCFVMADEIITVVLGSQWVESADIFRMLAVGALVQPISNTGGWLFVSTGRTRTLLKWGGINCTLIMASFFVGLPYGATGVAICYSCAILLLLVPGMYVATHGTLVTLWDIFKAARGPYLGALLGGAAVLGLVFLSADALDVWLRLGLGVAVMFATYVAVTFFLLGKKTFYLSVLRSLRTSEPSG